MRMRLSGDQNSELVFGADDSVKPDGGATNTTNDVIVPVTTLDIEVPRNQHVWMLKMDVQGAELHLLRGAMKLLREGRISWIYSEFDVIMLRAASLPGKPSSGMDLLNLLDEHGFACVNSRAHTWKTSLGYADPGNITDLIMRKNCGYSCRCRYTNIVCGHKSVAYPPSGWKHLLATQFCRQPGCIGRPGWDLLGRSLCTAPPLHGSSLNQAATRSPSRHQRQTGETVTKADDSAQSDSRLSA